MTATLEPSVDDDSQTTGPQDDGPIRPRRSLTDRVRDAARAGSSSLAPVRNAVTADTLAGKILRPVGSALLFFLVVDRVFDLQLKDYINGLALGSLYGVIAVAIILIYRTNRIINFAAAAIGAVPAIWALLLTVEDGHNYLLTGIIVLVGAPLFGALTDILIMRRFARAPRLILTVVTIGVARGLAAIGFFIPVWMGAEAGRIPGVPTPWDDFAITSGAGDKPILTGNQLAAFVAVGLVSVGLAAFLRYTRIGIALRASAENADRASLLGIPVKRVGMVAWMLSGLLGGVAIFVQAPLIGVPSNATLGFDSLLYGLAAAVVARMERIGVALFAGAGIGILIFGSVARAGDNNLASALMLVVILVALLVQKGAMSRAMDTGVSTWQAAKHFRPVPSELRHVPDVVVAKVVLAVVVLVIAIGAPFVLSTGDISQLIVLPIFGIVAVSLVVLTGWAGQISLGQFGLVGMAAGVSGGLIARHNIDFFAAMAIGIAVGVVSAVIVGLPAVRIQGMYLAVTTLAFGFAVQNYFLNRHYWFGKMLMGDNLAANIDRPMLYGRIDLQNKRTFYFVCLVFLGLSMFAAQSFRKNRSGRVLIAARDNARAAPAYSINLVRTRLAAFAVSGGIAGMAGVLLVYSQGDIVPQTYDVQASLFVFLAVVIGGLTSLPFAVIGAVTAQAFVLFSPRFTNLLGDNIAAIMPLLLTGPLLVLNLYFYPGGTAENGYAARDKFLRKVAAKRNLHVPSLVADRRVEQEQEKAQDVIVAAEQHVEEVDSFDVVGKLACPVCGELFTLAEASDHEHFRPGVKA